MSPSRASQPSPRPGGASYRDYAAPRRGAKAFFSRRSVAAGILAVTVLLGSYFGCVRSLNALRPEIAGTRVEFLLQQRAEVANNLVTVAENYVMNSLVKQVAEAASMLSHTKDPVSNDQLSQYAEELITLLEGMELSENDRKYLAGFRADLNGFSEQLLRTDYRDRAIAFNETLATEFPASLVAPLAGIEPAPLFE